MVVCLPSLIFLLISRRCTLIEQEKSNTDKNIFTHLLNSPNLTVKFALLVILSCTIFFIPGDGTFLNSDYHTAYAHFFGGETVNIDDYQIVFFWLLYPLPQSEITRLP